LGSRPDGDEYERGIELMLAPIPERPGAILRKLRLRKRLTQAELARMCGLPEQIIRKMENYGRGNVESWTTVLGTMDHQLVPQPSDLSRHLSSFPNVKVREKPFTTPLWLTQDCILRAFSRDQFCIDVSSPNPPYQPCKLFFDEDMNGLLQLWNGDLIWCNPDYTKDLLLGFAKKAIIEYKESRARCVLLLYPARLRTRYAKELVAAGAVRFLFDNRIEFGGRNQVGTFDSVLFVLGATAAELSAD
jgi:hypothetical protein